MMKRGGKKMCLSENIKYNEESSMVENIEYNGKLLAIIIYHCFDKPGITFFTPNDFSQQLAYMHHPKGKSIDPHVHNPVLREVSITQEVLLIRRGRLRVDFYDHERNYIGSKILGAGDVILLASAGHGFEVLDELEMIEVKQGPYVGAIEKTRFNSVCADDIRIME